MGRFYGVNHKAFTSWMRSSRGTVYQEAMQRRARVNLEGENVITRVSQRSNTIK
jgi:hypothetical protein